MNAGGEAHIYKYEDNKISWLDAYHYAVTGAGTLGGFKGYLATVTTQREALLLYNYQESVGKAGQEGWLALRLCVIQVIKI